jgi:hypothetical protein
MQRIYDTIDRLEKLSIGSVSCIMICLACVATVPILMLCELLLSTFIWFSLWYIHEVYGLRLEFSLVYGSGSGYHITCSDITNNTERSAGWQPDILRILPKKQIIKHTYVCWCTILLLLQCSLNGTKQKKQSCKKGEIYILLLIYRSMHCWL